MPCGSIFWVDCVIFICGLLGAATLRIKFGQLVDVFVRTAKNVFPVLITMGSLLVVAYVMQSPHTKMMSLIAGDIASFAGRFYPAAAVFIGSLGSFITGTGLGSNIMFADMHIEAAAALGMNPATICAGQNAGASLGNMICPNKMARMVFSRVSSGLTSAFSLLRSMFFRLLISGRITKRNKNIMIAKQTMPTGIAAAMYEA